MHRGETEPADWVGCRHLHADRAAFADGGRRGRGVRAGRRGRHAGDDTRPTWTRCCHTCPTRQLVLLSSMDVYEAFWLVLAGRARASRCRSTRTSRCARCATRTASAASARRLRQARRRTVLSGARRHGAATGHDLRRARSASGARSSSCAGYGRAGPHPGRHRFLAVDPLLRRRRRGRRAGDAWATPARPARCSTSASRRCAPCAVGPRRSWPRPGTTAELVTVPDAALPGGHVDDEAVAQHLVVDGDKAAGVLGWRPPTRPRDWPAPCGGTWPTRRPTPPPTSPPTVAPPTTPPSGRVTPPKIVELTDARLRRGGSVGSG